MITFAIGASMLVGAFWWGVYHIIDAPHERCPKCGWYLQSVKDKPGEYFCPGCRMGR